MSQALSAWSESPSQKCLYVGVLIGPFITAMVFNHPPVGGFHKPHEAFPPENAPQLIIFLQHILEDLKDWKMGLSAPLRYLFHLATTKVVKNFEQQVTQKPSRMFSVEGTPKASPHDYGKIRGNVTMVFNSGSQELIIIFFRKPSPKSLPHGI